MLLNLLLFFGTETPAPDTGLILETSRGLFSSLKGVFLLIFGVFFGVWLIQLLIGKWFEYLDNKIVVPDLITKREMTDIKSFFALAKKFGQPYTKKARAGILGAYREKKEKKLFLSLQKKFVGTETNKK